MAWNRYGEYNPAEVEPCTRGCGLCLKVCPFADHEEDEDTIGEALYGSVPGIGHRSEVGYHLATFVGYAVVYTVLLKPATPQNIVIGGASGAMPPVLGWAAVANEVSAPALVLFLIIFVWTPPHFWSLALYRIDDYRKSGLPMLPVTHGAEFTRLNILLYTLLLVATSLMPYLIGMSGAFYLASALALGAVFVAYAWRMWRSYSDALARKTFGYSIFYLAALFGALLVDHYLR